MQQVGEGWFASIAEMPETAISMTVRQILRAQAIICVVPDRRKADAVRACLEDPITPMAPASILRTHSNTTIYLDRDSASLLAPGISSRRTRELTTMARPLRGLRWYIGAVLFLSTVINYIDRQTLNFTDYQYLLFGGALVLMMLFRPEGLFPSQRRRRELHVADEMAGTFIDDDPAAIGAMGETPGADEQFGEDAAEDVPGHDR